MGKPGALVSAEALHAYLPAQGVQTDLKESLLVPRSPVLVDDPKIYLVGKEVILEAWFQEEVPGWFSLVTERVILSCRTRKISLSFGTEWVPSV